MLRPSVEQFEQLATQGNLIPVVREILADLDTPLSLFRRLDDGETSFLLESVQGGEKWARFSFLGTGARARFRATGRRVEWTHGDRCEEAEVEGDPLAFLRDKLAEFHPVELPGVELPRFVGGAVGMVAYEWVRFVEDIPDTNPDTVGMPDLSFTLPEVVVVYDNVRHTALIVKHADLRGGVDPAECYARVGREIDAVVERLREALPAEPRREPSRQPMEVERNMTREAYHEIVKRAKEYVEAGDVFQVVLAQQFTLPLQVDPFTIYRQLRAINPSPYLFYVRLEGAVIIGSSPEILVRLEGDRIDVRPIAGTRRRGRDPEDEARMEHELRTDPKEIAEHVMLVDLGRNDVGRIAQVGTVEVNEFAQVEKYSHVMHTVSNVQAKLAPGHDWLDVLRATFPAGTLSGAPKVRAMEIIHELETTRRGVYGGCVGYVDYSGNMDMAITIRTMVVKDDKITLLAGAGVVADSDPELEFKETLNKSRAAIQAIDLAREGDGLRPSMRLLMIDNYDSFTYNLVQYLGELGADVDVVRNDVEPVSALLGRAPDGLVISPGPGTPDDAGVSLECVRAFAERSVPVLGVCLGHQSIGQVFGGRIVRARSIMHGKTSMIAHDGKGVFAGLPAPFEATRYHSLVIEEASRPAELDVTARSEDGEIMGVRHRELPIEGVQFHPESILTTVGKDLLANFLETCRGVAA